MKKILSLFLILLSLTFFISCGEEEEEPTDTETLEGASDDPTAENVMWKMLEASNDPSPSTQYWQYKDGTLNTYYDNSDGKYYYPADKTEYVLDDEAKTLTYSGYTYTYTLSDDGTEFKLEYNSWLATFEKAEVDSSDFTAKDGHARSIENSFIKYLVESGLRSE